MSRTLHIPREIAEQLETAAKAGAPIEVCGLLAGNDGRVVRYLPMTNADQSPDHFAMVPEEQFAAAKEMRSESIQLLAVWHSHPASPAQMSEEDLRLAYTPDVLYTITSLTASKDESIRAYEVIDDVPHEVAIAVV